MNRIFNTFKLLRQKLLDIDLKSLAKADTKRGQYNLPLNKSIKLKNVHYNYPNESRLALRDISINIPAQTTVGLVGATGSGKSTTVDVILGLLEAQKGTLEIDNQIITKKNHNNKNTN